MLPNEALANIMQTSGRAPDAEKYLKSLIAIRRTLLASNPKGEKETEELAQSIDQLAMFLAQKNRAPEALILFNESITLSKQNPALPLNQLRNRLLIRAEIAIFAIKPRRLLNPSRRFKNFPTPGLRI